MPLLISQDGHATNFIRKSLESSSYDEKWLQELLFDRPELLTTEKGEQPIIPICRELPLKSPSSTVFLDLFCVRADGKPVLVECKLWRNPQARREVIGQILEYASLLQRLTFSDLEAIVRPQLSVAGSNPIFRVAQAVKPDLVEKDFVDSCHNYLSRGELDLIIAGDGIRSDIRGIKELLDSRAGLASTLRLVEVEVFESDQGELLVQSAAQSKTQTVKVTVAAQTPARYEDTDFVDESVIASTGEQNEWREQSKEFWQRFIDELHLEHPDQSPPKHGGMNTVWLTFPKPATHINCYRVKAKHLIGMFLAIEDTDDGRALYLRLLDDRSNLEDEVGHSLVYREHTAWSSKQCIAVESTAFDVKDKGQESAQLDYLKTHLNRLINALRRRIS